MDEAVSGQPQGVCCLQPSPRTLLSSMNTDCVLQSLGTLWVCGGQASCVLLGIKGSKLWNLALVTW